MLIYHQHFHKTKIVLFYTNPLFTIKIGNFIEVLCWTWIYEYYYYEMRFRGFKPAVSSVHLLGPLSYAYVRLRRSQYPVPLFFMALSSHYRLTTSHGARISLQICIWIHVASNAILLTVSFSQHLGSVAYFTSQVFTLLWY